MLAGRSACATWPQGIVFEVVVKVGSKASPNEFAVLSALVRSEQTRQNPQPTVNLMVPRYMYFPPVAKSFSRITMDLTGCNKRRIPGCGLIRKREHANWSLWIRLPRYGYLRLPRRFRHAGLLLSCRWHAHLRRRQRQHPFFRKEFTRSDSAQRALGAPRVFSRPGRIGAQGASNFSSGGFRAGIGRACAASLSGRRPFSGALDRHPWTRRLDHEN